MSIIQPDFSKIPIWRREPKRLEAPITAYRVWLLDLTNILYSIASPFPWEGPVVHADKRPYDISEWDKRAAKTSKDATDYETFTVKGIHAVKTLHQAVNLPYRSDVVGEVKLWGRVSKHTLGYRAEYCMVSKLYLLLTQKRRARSDTSIIKALESRYQCDVIAVKISGGAVYEATTGKPIS